MVSTRGPKFKFCDGEKVLCYEPDPTKAKVLYDSKVLDVIINKDQRGRKAVEYLIHFQGWNSSWDRCVTEEYVLKDTEENRQLQRDLAQKAQLQLGAYLYRRERKNRSHKLSDRSGIESRRRARSGGSRAASGTTGSSEDGSSGQQDDYDTEEVITEEESESSSDFGGPSTDDEDSGGGSQSGASVRPGIDLDIGNTLRRILDQDYELVNHKHKLTKKPPKKFADNELQALLDEDDTQSQQELADQLNVTQKAMGKIQKDRNMEKDLALSYYHLFALMGHALAKQCFNSYENLAVLPAQPTVANILESWVQHFTTTQLTNIPEKSQRNKTNNTVEKIVNDVNICREVADGLRIYFDFTLPNLLLYRQEREQYNAFKSSIMFTEHPVPIKEEIIDNPDMIIKEEIEDPEYAHLPPFREHESSEVECPSKPICSKRILRSCRVSSIDDNRQLRSYEDVVKQEPGSVSSIASTSSRCSSPRGVITRPPVVSSVQIGALLHESNKWRLMPDSAREENLPSPSVYFGAAHLARLFVKLPDLLQVTDMPEKKLKVLLKHLDMFLSYLEMHREWFGEQFYTQTETRPLQQ